MDIYDFGSNYLRPWIGGCGIKSIGVFVGSAGRWPASKSGADGPTDLSFLQVRARVTLFFLFFFSFF